MPGVRSLLAVVEKIDPGFQQTLEMGGGQKTAYSTCTDFEVPGVAFDFGIISTSVPLGPETSKGPCWPSSGSFHFGFRRTDGSEAWTKEHLIHIFLGY